MKHSVLCSVCERCVDFELPGDLGQYRDSFLYCPCTAQELVVIRSLDNGTELALSISALVPSTEMLKKYENNNCRE